MLLAPRCYSCNTPPQHTHPRPNHPPDTADKHSGASGTGTGASQELFPHAKRGTTRAQPDGPRPLHSHRRGRTHACACTWRWTGKRHAQVGVPANASLLALARLAPLRAFGTLATAAKKNKLDRDVWDVTHMVF